MPRCASHLPDHPQGAPVQLRDGSAGALMMWDPAQSPSGRRTVDEASTIELILLHGWALDVRAGNHGPAAAAAAAALDRFVTLGLPYAADHDGGRLFDPVELLHFARWAFHTLGDRVFADHFVATGRRMVWDAFGGCASPDQPPPPGAVAAGTYRLRLMRTFNLVQHEPGARVRLRLPAPLPGGTTSQVCISAVLDPGMGQALFSPARLDVQATVPESRMLTAGFDCVLTQAPHDATPGLSSADAALYTRETEGLVRVTPAVRSLAACLAGHGTAPGTILRRFWTYLCETLSISAVHYDQLDPACPLDPAVLGAWSDCRVASALLVALCRCRNIPARLVGGYMLHPAAPAQHTWLEVWLPESGWCGLDLADLSFNGRDAAWRDTFFGQLSQRVAVERPPRLFSGLGPSLRLPGVWQMTSRLHRDGVRLEFHTVDMRTLVYRDDITVQRLA